VALEAPLSFVTTLLLRGTTACDCEVDLLACEDFDVVVSDVSLTFELARFLLGLATGDLQVVSIACEESVAVVFDSPLLFEAAKSFLGTVVVASDCELDEDTFVFRGFVVGSEISPGSLSGVVSLNSGTCGFLLCKSEPSPCFFCF